ncbi:MAG: ABC transporter ATP-binding protein [Halanaeroarchaeum sp.]
MTDLHLDAIRKEFGETTALEDVSLDVTEGEFFTLVGPSGCGKTTTLRIVAGLEEPSAGTVRFGSADVAERPPEERGVGIVFQNYALFPHMNVRENVAYGLRFRDPPAGQTTAERVDELLELVDLPHIGNRDPEQLSGGQRQRIALARALAPGPDLLLLDEPMSALDARLRERLRRQVKRIQQELSITTLYVTHDQAEALAISDRIAVMNEGRVEQIGAPEAVYREPANRFVAEFVGDNNLFEVSDLTHESPGERRGVVDGVTVPIPATVESGDVFAVRPEAMAFASRGAGIDVTVETVEFLGDAYKAYCSWNDRTLLVKTGSEPPTGRAAITFDVDDVHVVSDRA